MDEEPVESEPLKTDSTEPEKQKQDHLDEKNEESESDDVIVVSRIDAPYDENPSPRGKPYFIVMINRTKQKTQNTLSDLFLPILQLLS